MINRFKGLLAPKSLADKPWSYFGPCPQCGLRRSICPFSKLLNTNRRCNIVEEMTTHCLITQLSVMNALFTLVEIDII